MIRQIIEIDEAKCNGCGACATACQEDAIAIINGKAKLIRDDYCDGLGNCLPACPTAAIRFIEREAAAFDEEAVKRNQAAKAAAEKAKTADTLPCGCAGTQSKQIERQTQTQASSSQAAESQLSQWPVQIKLVPTGAPYFQGANLLIAADCTAYAYGDFHNKFIKNHITLVGCPKLDEGDYTDKLTAIIRDNDIKSVTVVRMEVPCCGGIEKAATNALKASGKFIPWQVVTISTDGRIIE